MKIVFIEVVIILILSGAVIAKERLVGYMTEYNQDYSLVVKK